MGIWLFLLFLAIMNNDAMNIHGKFLYGYKFSFLLAAYRGVELLGPRVMPYLTF